MATPSFAMPTLPFLSSAGERRALLAGITFIEGSASGVLRLVDLQAWFEEHIVSGGVMPQPDTLSEPQGGSIVLYPRSASSMPTLQNVSRLTTIARNRVIAALRGLLMSPVDDRFVAGALFANRVRRQRGARGNQWAAHPEPTTPLSGIVLSLFVVDILSHRDEYDQRLCVCDSCGRVSFQKEPDTRRRCHEHTGHASGFMRAVQPRRRSDDR